VVDLPNVGLAIIAVLDVLVPFIMILIIFFIVFFILLVTVSLSNHCLRLSLERRAIEDAGALFLGDSRHSIDRLNGTLLHVRYREGPSIIPLDHTWLLLLFFLRLDRRLYDRADLLLLTLVKVALLLVVARGLIQLLDRAAIAMLE